MTRLRLSRSAVECFLDFGDQIFGTGVQERQVQVKFAWEVLVQNGLAHPCPFGDIVHGRTVVALVL